VLDLGRVGNDGVGDDFLLAHWVLVVEWLGSDGRLLRLHLLQVSPQSLQVVVDAELL
jgi:hypothetical protein